MAKGEKGDRSKLFYVLLGAVIGFLSALGHDCIKEYQTRKKLTNELTTMIYINVRNIKTSLDEFNRDYPREETIKAIEQSSKPEESLIISDFDTYVLEAYIHKIPLLSVNMASRILAFYGDLKNINEAKYILLNKDLNLSLKSKSIWAKSLYNALECAIENGKYILKHFKEQDKDNLLGDPNAPNIMSSGTATI